MKEPKPVGGAEQERRRSPLVGILIGCGVLVMLCGMAACGVGIWGYRTLTRQLDEFAADFEAKGYQRKTGQVFDVREPISEPRVYIAQVVKLHSDVDADLALMCQVVEIHGTVDGDIEFLGQVLVVEKNGVVKGNIHSRGAQVIQVKGTVEGKITGTYQALNAPNN